MMFFGLGQTELLLSKVEESSKQEIFAAMVYERNGGRFEMYDVVEKGLKRRQGLQLWSGLCLQGQLW